MKPKSTRNEVGFNEFARNLKLNKKKNTRIKLERNCKFNYEKLGENYAADNINEFDDIHDSNKNKKTNTTAYTDFGTSSVNEEKVVQA